MLSSASPGGGGWPSATCPTISSTSAAQEALEPMAGCEQGPDVASRTAPWQRGAVALGWR